MAADEENRRSSKGEAQMKKLIPLMVGLCLTFGTIATFAQETPKKEETPVKKGKKKGGKKKAETPKKDSSIN
jgi:hypothetical protein